MKKCKKCNKILPLSKFYKDSTMKGGFHPYCKTCKNEYAKERRRKFPEMIKEIQKRWRNKNPNYIPPCIVRNPDYRKEWDINNPEERKAISKKYRECHPEKIKSRYEKYYERNRNKILKSKKEYREKRKKQIRKLIGDKCIVKGCNNKTLEFHEKYFKGHDTAKYTYYINHYKDFIPLCITHHRALHAIHDYFDELKDLLCLSIHKEDEKRKKK